MSLEGLSPNEPVSLVKSNEPLPLLCPYESAYCISAAGKDAD